MKHVLITGDRGVGKSTLIRTVLQQKLSSRNLAGFFTCKGKFAEDGFHEIRIYPAWETERPDSRRNLIGLCDTKVHQVNIDVFNDMGVECIRRSCDNPVIVMDELGFMEAEASGFTASVLDSLNGEIPVIAAVKNRTDIPFLSKILSHPNAEVFYLDERSRDEVLKSVCSFIEDKWL